ncbi:MAG: reverse transcriptase family protein, partial [Nitrosomonadaceae bacterium]
EAASNVIGFKSRKNEDWFDDSDHIISPLLEHKQQLHNKLLTSNINPNCNIDYKNLKRTIQHKLRTMKESWWLKKAIDAQAAADRNDSKAFYSYIHKVFGPSRAAVAPIHSKDGRTLYKDVTSIQTRWVEHYSELLNRPSTVNMDVVNKIPQRPIINAMSADPSFGEVAAAVKKLNSGKAPDMNGLTAELLKSGGEAMITMLHTLMLHYWKMESVPQDWVDAILVSLYKSGQRDQCGNFRGISLLSIAGKVLARILLDRLNEHISPYVISESQCGFRPNRGTADMIFSVRQLQEKCIEQDLDLFHCFIDLSKAFDTVNREALWVVLRKCGCPDKFVNMIKSLHADMKARVNFGGNLSEPFNVDNGVKQGDLDAPTLFAIYFACMILVAFDGNPEGIYIRYRTSGSVFDLARLRAKTKVLVSLVRDLLYADDCDLVSHNEAGLQSLVDSFDTACDAFGFTINIKKTVVMYQPAPSKPYHKPSILVKNKLLEVVDSFVYLGGSISRTGSLDVEISARIQKAAASFGKLVDKVWSQHNIKRSTKLLVYRAFVLTSLLYTSETWTTYVHQIKCLERFHQKCLRHILKIKWQDMVPDTEVLAIANIPSIECLITLHRLRWSGHLVRLDDKRIPKQLFFGELCGGKRRHGHPKLRFKDVLKDSLKKVKIHFKLFENLSRDRVGWRSLIKKNTSSFEDERVSRQQLKRAARKGILEQLPEGENFFPCSGCNRICLSRAGLIAHTRTHSLVTHQCHLCHKYCKSGGGLKRHVRIHDTPVTTQNKYADLTCNICQKTCRSLAGLKSHYRAHKRSLKN